MPLLANLIAAIATWFASSGFARVSARWFWLSMLATITIGAYVGTVAAFNSYLVPLTAQAFSTSYGQFLGLAFPPVAGTCMASFFGALLFSFFWKLKRQLIEIVKGGGN